MVERLSRVAGAVQLRQLRMARLVARCGKSFGGLGHVLASLIQSTLTLTRAAMLGKVVTGVELSVKGETTL